MVHSFLLWQEGPSYEYKCIRTASGFLYHGLGGTEMIDASLFSAPTSTRGLLSCLLASATLSSDGLQSGSGLIVQPVPELDL